MKWSSLLKDIRDKVGFPSQPQAGPSGASAFSAAAAAAAATGAGNRASDAYESVSSPGYESALSSPAARY